MNCDHFHLRLNAWLAGDLDRDEESALQQHADVCEECASVLSLMRQSPALEDASFVHGVLVQTTGAVCSVVESEMGDWLDRRLERVRSREIAGHVDACPRCHELAAAMRRCDALLPEMAELEPDANFTADVLMATLHSASLWHVAWRRAIDLCGQLFRRPAFPMEASFVATVALVIVTATPLAPWPQLPARALAVVQTIGTTEPGAEATPARWAGLSDTPAWQAVDGFANRVETGISSRWQILQPRLERVELDFHELGRAAIHLDFDAWPAVAQSLGKDVMDLWQGPDPSPAPDSSRSSDDE